jgi:hypothetical protein
MSQSSRSSQKLNKSKKNSPRRLKNGNSNSNKHPSRTYFFNIQLGLREAESEAVLVILRPKIALWTKLQEILFFKNIKIILRAI